MATVGAAAALTLTAGCQDLRVPTSLLQQPAAAALGDRGGAPDGAGGAGATPATTGAPAGPAAGDVVWADEFDGPAGSPPDPSAWTYRTGGAWGDGELQHYRDSTDNAALDGDGHLVITARRGGEGLSCWYGACDYTSARLDTAGKVERAYGRFEARIRIPTGQGIWPAFWLLGNDLDTVGWPASGEIDVMEHIGSEPDRIVGYLHGPGHDVGGGHTLPQGEAFADDFRTYAVEWTPQRITWFVDDVEFHSAARSDVGGTWVYDHPFFVVLNVAVGGSWPGAPDASTSFPQRMVVDHVRIIELGR